MTEAKKSEQKELSIEERFEKLDGIVEQMESGECSLEDTFSLYRSGMEELKEVDATIKRVEEAVLLLSEDGEIREFEAGEPDEE